MMLTASFILAVTTLFPLSGINPNTQRTQTVTMERTTKGAVILFLSTRCPCSQSHMNHVVELSKNYPEFTFVGLLPNRYETANTALTLKNRATDSFHILIDEDAKMADRFQALKTPHAFIVGSKGDILYDGGLSNSMKAERAQTFYLENALKDIQENKKPREQHAKALGCAIMRR